MTRDEAIKSMDAVVQCLYLQVEKSVCDDVFGCWMRCKEALDQHDAEQREEITRLREALQSIVKIRFLLGNDPKLNPAYEMGDIAQQALTQEPT